MAVEPCRDGYPWRRVTHLLSAAVAGRVSTGWPSDGYLPCDVSNHPPPRVVHRNDELTRRREGEHRDRTFLLRHLRPRRPGRPVVPDGPEGVVHPEGEHGGLGRVQAGRGRCRSGTGGDGPFQAGPPGPDRA